MKTLQEQEYELKNINKHRKLWLFLSSIVLCIILFIVFSWNGGGNQKVLWAISSMGLLISVVWWYWTMRMIRILVIHRLSEIQILKDLCNDVKDLKQDVKKNFAKDLTE